MRSAGQNVEEFGAEVVPNVTLYCRNEDIEEEIRKERCDLSTHLKRSDYIYVLSLNQSGLAERKTDKLNGGFDEHCCAYCLSEQTRTC